MKLTSIFKEEKQSSKDLLKAISEVQAKVTRYGQEKAKAESELESLQEMAVLGEQVDQKSINNLTATIQDLEQKLKASESALKKLEHKRVEAVKREGSDRLKEVKKEITVLEEKKRAALQDLITDLAALATQVEAVYGVSRSSWTKQFGMKHFDLLQGLLGSEKVAFHAELEKIPPRQNLSADIKTLQKERDILLAEQKVEREAENRTVEEKLASSWGEGVAFS